MYGVKEKITDKGGIYLLIEISGLEYIRIR
jgi:hypothetical protein